MKLTRIASNMTEVELTGDKLVLFSYETPVAARVDGKIYKTDCRWSRTTSKHITKWLQLFGPATEVDGEKPQSYFNDLAEGN